MIVGKAGGTRVVGEVRESDRRGIRDHRAEQPLAGGQVTDVLGGDRVDPDVDEALEASAVGSDDAERAVAGVDQPHRRLDDATQHDFEIQTLDDRGVRAQQVSEPPLRERRVVGSLPGTPTPSDIAASRRRESSEGRGPAPSAVAVLR